jgi:hypothetical protein
MTTLAQHVNVYDTAAEVLRRKGYQLWFVPESQTYYAEKDGWDFAADSTVGLLGIIAIFEFEQPQEWKEYWWRLPTTGSYRDLPATPSVSYTPVYRRRRS